MPFCTRPVTDRLGSSTRDRRRGRDFSPSRARYPTRALLQIHTMSGGSSEGPDVPRVRNPRCRIRTISFSPCPDRGPGTARRGLAAGEHPHRQDPYAHSSRMTTSAPDLPPPRRDRPHRRDRPLRARRPDLHRRVQQPAPVRSRPPHRAVRDREPQRRHPDPGLHGRAGPLHTRLPHTTRNPPELPSPPRPRGIKPSDRPPGEPHPVQPPPRSAPAGDRPGPGLRRHCGLRDLLDPPLVRLGG
ncbi:hypothetical protein SAMN05421854_11933 [Amycolatopsis rubida]|uniref:Uncharacterized protein n=1 Tax=Amycolatopsis rubida TaxID=112413 RepID=A0A1I6AII9_9PSEU|nr:hypothetical protein SAMN05421854_11933 [Amycolatopsis rubida]